MSLSSVFIKRPVATTLLSLGTVIAGFVAVGLLPVSALPQVDFPTIAVFSSLPGASPETMATSVATPLERQFSHIAGVREMSSTSNLGSTTVVMQFDISRNIDGAARDVQAAINAARSSLPANLPFNPLYRKVNPSDPPILILVLTSDTYTIPKMYDVASSVLQQELSQVDGVGQVIVGGSSLPAVRVELNPSALNKYGISLNTVAGVLASNNSNRPKGQLENATNSWTVKANDQLFKAEDYKPIILAYRAGLPTRLSDVAEVYDSIEDIRNAGSVNGDPAVALVIFRQPGANIIATVDRVRGIFPRLQALIPTGMKLSVSLDRTPTIRASLREAQKTIIFSVLLVILVVFFFLSNLRATFIPSTVVPISLVSTLWIMYFLKFSLNNLSLMALTIATGFVVDDSIVVVENITRHLEMGATPMEAAMKGVRQIAFTIMSISISLVAVFTPILLMGGILGRLFREFAVTLSVAILVSLCVSLTTTPMMCAYLFKQQEKKPARSLSNLSGRLFNVLYRGYKKSLLWALRHAGFMLGLSVAILFINVLLYVVVPKGFFPQQDTGRLTGSIIASQDISFQSMVKKLQMAVNIIKEDPAVDIVTAFTGAIGSTRNTARMFIALKDLEVRKLSADRVIARLRKKLSSIPGAPVYLQAVQDLRVTGMSSAAQYQYTLTGDNLQELMYWAPRVTENLRGVHVLADVNSDQQNSGLQTALTINRDAASRYGITAQLIDTALGSAFGQRQVSIMYTQLNQYHVVMEVAPEYWQRPETLRDLYVKSPGGEMVPLSVFASYEQSSTSLAVNHYGQTPDVTISFNLPPRVSLGDAVNAIEAVANKIRLPASIRSTFLGSAQAFKDSLANEPLLILAALIAVYIVLGILYESYIHPITILSTLPSAGVGALLALLIFHVDLDIISLIGVILLIGIVKKNGILMVDFAIDAERTEGKPPAEAIYQACLLRFRPIMMTTMAAMLGALPLALGAGMGAELRRPLGISIIGGLALSQMLTLFTTPVIYLWMDRFRIRIARGKGGT